MASMSSSILASASHVIPGVPEPTSLAFPDWIKAANSVTAWMIFVLYAGPVASLFPARQERLVKRGMVLYERLRIARKTLYAPLVALNNVANLMRESPEVQRIANCIFFFKMQPDLNRMFREEPDAARILKGRPDIIEILTNAGIVLPNLDDFIPPEAAEGGAGVPSSQG